MRERLRPRLCEVPKLCGAVLVVSRTGGVTGRSSGYGPVEIGVRVIRIQADCLAAILNGALVVVQPQPRISPGIERQGVRGINLQALD